MKLTDPKDIACYDILAEFARALINPFHVMNSTLARCISSSVKRSFMFYGTVLDIRPMPNDELGVFIDAELGYLRITSEPFMVSYVHILKLEPDGTGVEIFYDASETPRTSTHITNNN